MGKTFKDRADRWEKNEKDSERQKARKAKHVARGAYVSRRVERAKKF